MPIGIQSIPVIPRNLEFKIEAFLAFLKPVLGDHGPVTRPVVGPFLLGAIVRPV